MSPLINDLYLYIPNVWDHISQVVYETFFRIVFLSYFFVYNNFLKIGVESVEL